MRQEIEISDAGKSAPFIVTLIDKSGHERKQLIKSQDDVRQDKIVQSLFGFLNRIVLTYSFESVFQTYKVVPFNEKSGLIGWLESTVTVRDCLFKKGLFANGISLANSLFPEDYDQATCRTKLSVAQKDGNVREAFDAILQNTHVILPFYFMSVWPLPFHFALARDAYVHTMALNSILGHVLGIGDRHLKNILLCSSTGSIAHIDFGYMFEIGRMLQIPERVPFRLTREMLSLIPHGGESWNGFNTVCLHTLGLLRRHHGTITSAISVVLDNALLHWRKDHDMEDAEMNDNKHNHSFILDPLMDKSKNFEARKALLRVRHKLLGREFSALSLNIISTKSPSEAEWDVFPHLPNPNGVSLEAQLDILLAWAVNKDLLAQMFVGWAPWT